MRLNVMPTTTPTAPTKIVTPIDPANLRVIIYGTFLLFFVLAWTRNVNWDEFLFLSIIHDHVGGRLTQPVQTGYVHIFGWLIAVPGDEMTRIFLGRLVMTGFFAATVFSIYRIASHLTDSVSGTIAVVAFLSSGFVLAHGTSFRADPIAAALLMGALAFMVTSRMATWQIAVVAVLSAAALFVTIKAALYLPAFLAVLIWRANNIRVSIRIAVAGLLGLGVAYGLFSWHAAGLQISELGGSVEGVERAMDKTLSGTALFPRASTSSLWALLSIGPFCLAVLGLATCLNRRVAVLAVGFTLPLVLSVVFYRNAFPYFFPFIASPFMVIAAFGAARLGTGPVLASLVAISVATGLGQGVKSLAEGAGVQRETIAEVRRLFPEPVAYIDQTAMISEYPRDLFFMSTWGIESYRAADRPVMASYIADAQPPFLLANRWALHQALTSPTILDHAYALFPEDQEALRASYVHYSGVIWLAGKRIATARDVKTVQFDIFGTYRVETAAPITINGRSYQDGDLVELGGAVQVSGADGGEVLLIWHTSAELNFDALPRGGVYAGFWEL